jgi:hypothetical protein
LLIAAEDLAVIDNADAVPLGVPAIDRGRNLVIRHQPDGPDPGRVVADRAQAEADLVIVRKSPISVPLAPVLSITSIDPGDHDIDRILGGGLTARIGGR